MLNHILIELQVDNIGFTVSVSIVYWSTFYCLARWFWIEEFVKEICNSILYAFLQFTYMSILLYSQTSVHERLGSRTVGLQTNFPNTKRLGWHTVSQVTNTQAVNIMEQ
jgi:hypothetical protein